MASVKLMRNSGKYYFLQLNSHLEIKFKSLKFQFFFGSRNTLNILFSQFFFFTWTQTQLDCLGEEHRTAGLQQGAQRNKNATRDKSDSFQ